MAESNSKKCGMATSCCKLAHKLLKIADVFHPFFILFLRLWIAKIFWYSGAAKWSNINNAKALFQYEYMFPKLPEGYEAYQDTAYTLATYGATFVELGCSVLIAVGLATRIAAIPVLAMAVVIQYALPESYYHIEHFYWMMLCGLFILQGPGKLSVDHLMCKKCLPNRY